MIESRVINTKRNIISGFIKQISNIIFPFIIRTIILYRLGVLYQGLNGLFSSVLQVLNLTELGFSNAVVFVLYKPIAENDSETISAIINFLKKIYFTVGMVMLLLGLVIMPFLPYFIAGDYPADINIYLLFFIYLFNTIISYMLFSYKSALFIANQREDVVSNIYTITSFFTKVCQIVLLLLLNNYYIYIIVMPIGTIINNILLQFYSKKYFPEIITKGKITTELKDIINKQVKAIFINKVGDVARNSFDNIVLSSLLGLTVVAIYNNYYYIFSALYGIMLMISHSMQASVGNSVVKESIEKNYNDFIKFSFIYSWITGWATISMVSLYQPFMIIWMSGKSDMLLSFGDMLLLCIYFYFISMNNIRNLYLNVNGL